MEKYRISPEAETDLYRIWLYGVEHWGMEAADKYHNAFFEQFIKIASFPKQYQSVNHIREGYRHCLCGRDTIYYRIEN